MKTKMARQLAGLFVSFIASAAAWAGCDITNSDLAISAYSLKGQGNFTCKDLGMLDVSSSVTPMFSGSTKLKSWQVNGPAPVPGAKGDQRVDAVMIEPSSGKRCLVNYPDFARQDFGTDPTDGLALESPDGSDIDTLLFCDDPNNDKDWPDEQSTPNPPDDPDPLPEPKSTAGVKCFGQIWVPAPDSDPETTNCGDPTQRDGIVCVDEPMVTVTGVSANGVAVCTGSLDQVQGNQIRCIDECPINENYDAAACKPWSDGTFPAKECSRCGPSTSSAEFRYCWEYVDKYCTSDDVANDPRCDGRTPWTIIPAQSMGTYGNAQLFNGSTCYVNRINIGGVMYSYTTCY